MRRWSLWEGFLEFVGYEFVLLKYEDLLIFGENYEL